MPSPHLWIPHGLTRVEPVIRAVGGQSFVREDPATHSRGLLEAFNRSAAMLADKHDFDVATDLIVQITTAPGWSAARERQHLRNLGFEIVALSEESPNVAIARISRETLPKFSAKLERYAGTTKHIGKSNFGAIEAITPVGIEQKIEPSLARADPETDISCLITLFGSLPVDMKQRIATRLSAELREMGKQEVTICN